MYSVYVQNQFSQRYLTLFRTMKFGEIGCFLSHYNIWKAVSI